MTAIYDHGTVVAHVEGDQIALHPHIATLPPDHPERRWTLALALATIRTSPTANHDDPEAFARDARARLIPSADVATLATLPLRHAAHHFGVPPRQARIRRAELGLSTQ
ncbi:MAG: hypothetical protein GXY03_05925 [Solirubrobacterales bacterium]|nr:hypothetical protein [Solirubrobacterales bacterium]